MSMYENMGMTSLDYINEIQRLQADVAKLTVENEKLLNKIAKIQFELDDVVSEWISVNDRLPESFTTVLAHYTDGRIHTVGYLDRFMTTRGTVTHWMPLPKPPKEE